MRASDMSPVRHGLMALLALMVAGSALAEPKKDQDLAVRRLRQQLQEVQQEQGAMQDQLQKASADKAAVEADHKKTKAELDGIKGAAAAANRRANAKAQELDESMKARQALVQKLALVEEQLKQANDSLKHTQESLDDKTKAEARLTARGHQQDEDMASCAAHNVALYKLGGELLSRYQNKGLAEVLKSNEPFTQTQRVALENLVQGYRDQLEKEQLSAVPAPAAGR